MHLMTKSSSYVRTHETRLQLIRDTLNALSIRYGPIAVSSLRLNFASAHIPYHFPRLLLESRRPY